MASSSSRIFGNRCRALMTAAKSAAAAATADAAAMPMRATGIMKVQSVSPALAQFLGNPEASRSGAIKKVWEYVKSQNLQNMEYLKNLLSIRHIFGTRSGLPDVFRVPAKNPSNKKEVLCDEQLKAIFDGNDMVNFQGVAKLLSNHFPNKA